MPIQRIKNYILGKSMKVFTVVFTIYIFITYYELITIPCDIHNKKIILYWIPADDNIMIRDLEENWSQVLRTLLYRMGRNQSLRVF